jgi:hypothetical protein
MLLVYEIKYIINENTNKEFIWESELDLDFSFPGRIASELTKCPAM